MEGVVLANGIELRYVREGKGEPLLVIGGSVYHKMFSAGLREHFDMIFADCRHFVPSYGTTPEELERITLDTFVDEVEAVRKELGLGRISVLGHSVHAQIALAYALKYPEHTSRAVLVCGVPYPLGDLTPEQERYWDESASDERKSVFLRDQEAYADELQSAPPDQQFGIFYLANTAKYWADPEYDAKALISEFRVSVALDRLFAVVPKKPEVRARLELLRAPGLVITGRHDYICPMTVWETLIEGLGGITYRCIKESARNPQTEHPELFDRALLEWFGLV